MIADLFFYIIAFLINIISFILPAWHIWPATFTNGIYYTVSTMKDFNIIFPIDTMFSCILFFINFLVLFATALIIIKVVNYFRGASGL